MKYYICEGSTSEGKYNATSKARQDAETILDSLFFKPLKVETINRVKNNIFLKLLQYFGYLQNYYIWKKSIKKLNYGDVLVIQYPIIYTTLPFTRILKKLKKRGIKTIAIIHDLDSIRMANSKSLRSKRLTYEDKNLLKQFAKVISHNEKMTNILVEYGVERSNAINLGIFDYLCSSEIDVQKRKKYKPIIIAGNLSSEKAKYLKDINNISKVHFDLYGKGLDIKLAKNITNRGCFLPAKLPKVLDGSFGLVWDGSSINKLEGSYGDYMKYNNPHKASLYLASELPVIVSTESALSKFVKKNGVGITVKSLKELESILESIKEEDYLLMLNNVKKVSKKIKEGFFLTKSVEEALKNLE